MKHILESVDILFAKILEILNKHNEVFLVENQEDFGYFNAHGEDVYEGDYQVYTDVDRFGHHNTYAIMKLENGVAHLFGIGDTEGTKEISIDIFSIAELYDLANLCNLVEEPNE